MSAASAQKPGGGGVKAGVEKGEMDSSGSLPPPEWVGGGQQRAGLAVFTMGIC